MKSATSQNDPFAGMSDDALKAWIDEHQKLASKIQSVVAKARRVEKRRKREKVRTI